MPSSTAQPLGVARRKRDKGAAHPRAPRRRVRERLKRRDQRRQVDALAVRREPLDRERTANRERAVVEDHGFGQRRDPGEHARLADHAPSVARRIVEATASRIQQKAVACPQPRSVRCPVRWKRCAPLS
jgi:hypothetical protein